MRVIKDPEVRKQEILNTAIQLFCKRGYDQTSISDIAKEMGVSQGLCYRYFPSKENIYELAVDRYADFLVEQRVTQCDFTGKPLREQIRMMSGTAAAYETVERAQPELYTMFHQSGSQKIHNQLFLAVCARMVPIVKKSLLAAQTSGEIHISDIDTLSYFFVYGQMGIMMREDLSDEEKESRIQNSLIELLKL